MSVYTSRGWVVADVTDGTIASAMARQDEFDRKAPGNVFDPRTGHDTRYIGFIAEEHYNEWLAEVAPDSVWIRDQSTSDFIVHGRRVQVKCGGIHPTPRYNCQANHRHVETPTPADYFFFAAYDEAIPRLWLTGGIKFEMFKEGSVFHPEGSLYGLHHVIGKGQAMYDISEARCTRPIPWLESLQGVQADLFL